MTAKMTYVYANPAQRGVSLLTLLEKDVNDRTFMLTWFNYMFLGMLPVASHPEHLREPEETAESTRSQ